MRAFEQLGDPTVSPDPTHLAEHPLTEPRSSPRCPRPPSSPGPLPVPRRPRRRRVPALVAGEPSQPYSEAVLLRHAPGLHLVAGYSPGMVGRVVLRWVIGSCLRQARQGKGWTLREVAAAAGVSVGHLSEVERGRKEPSSEVLAAICRALGLDLVDLLRAAQWELAKRRLPRLGLTASDVALAA